MAPLVLGLRQGRSETQMLGIRADRDLRGGTPLGFARSFGPGHHGILILVTASKARRQVSFATTALLPEVAGGVARPVARRAISIIVER